LIPTLWGIGSKILIPALMTNDGDDQKNPETGAALHIKTSKSRSPSLPEGLLNELQSSFVPELANNVLVGKYPRKGLGFTF